MTQSTNIKPGRLRVRWFFFSPKLLFNLGLLPCDPHLQYMCNISVDVTLEFLYPGHLRLFSYFDALKLF